MTMAHFAELDSNNIVVRVLVVPDEHESRGTEFLSKDLGFGGTWIQTSYTGKIRGKFAAVGNKYDEKNDVFVHIQTPEEIALNKAIEAKMTARAAAFAKLQGLGLTEDEVNGLIP
jgi:hypothetical protein